MFTLKLRVIFKKIVDKRKEQGSSIQERVIFDSKLILSFYSIQIR